MTGALVLRPEPGNTRTRERLAKAGIEAVALPLFAVTPLAWALPDLARFDSVLLTSANAARHGGAGLVALVHLPVIAVGEATARDARAAGFAVAVTGSGDVEDALSAARDRGLRCPLHLAGRDHRASGAATVLVYASEPVEVAPGAMTLATGRVALLHSARAARRFAELIERDRVARAAVAVAALSPAVLAAAGPGWRWSLAAPVPSDAALVAAVRDRLTGPASPRISGA